jgi:hypothetical protein
LRGPKGPEPARRIATIFCVAETVDVRKDAAARIGRDASLTAEGAGGGG